MKIRENEMVSLQILIDDYFNKKEVYIPLLQRNYKWSEEAAATLSQDLWDAYNNNKDKIYTIGMITIYDDPKSNQKVQLIDGQQRIVTLTLLLKHLDNKRQYFKFKFERDEELIEEQRREYFIENNLKKECDEENLYADTIRFKRNYDAISLPLTIADVERVNCQVNKYNFSSIKDCEIVKVIKEFELESVEDEILSILFSLKEESQIALELKLLLLSKRIFSFIDVSKNISYAEIFKVVESIPEDGIFFDKDVTYNSDEKKRRDIKLKKYVCKIRKELLKIKDIQVDSNEKTQDYLKYILNKVEILFHITKSQSIDEFLNINKNKTRFVISDYIKANLIIDTKNNKEERERILSLFNMLSSYLFKAENKELWDLINQGYSIEKDENRLKVLFCDRYHGNNKKGYIYDLEYKRLSHYKLILEKLLFDIQQLEYWNAYNGFNCLYVLKHKRFFEMFGLRYDDNSINKCLEKIILDNILEDNNFQTFNYYLESQLYNNKIIEDIYSNLPIKLEEGWGHIMEDYKLIDEFKKIFDYYLSKRRNLIYNEGN